MTISGLSLPRPWSKKVRILMTGAAGYIGQFLYQTLNQNYQIRCLDIQSLPSVKDFRQVDICDFDSVFKAMKAVDIVIHLAGNPSPQQSWHDVYTSGIKGTFNIFEAARQRGIHKIIYASTNHVSDGWETEKTSCITPEMPVRPHSIYGVGKVCGEALARYFCEQHAMSISCLRIGSFQANPQPKNIEDRVLKTWCSPRDLSQMVKLILQKEDLGFQIFYAISGNSNRFWDISNAEELLGYQPKDNGAKLIEASASPIVTHSIP